jgi:hypothetical protein
MEQKKRKETFLRAKQPIQQQHTSNFSFLALIPIKEFFDYSQFITLEGKFKKAQKTTGRQSNASTCAPSSP